MKVIRNVAYTEEREPRHRLELFVPHGAEPFATLLFVSGGGWRAGSRHWVVPVAEHLVAEGFGVALVDHRLVPAATPHEQAADLASAFAWLRANLAAHGGDPTRLAVGGHSAGGHLTSLLATDARYLATVGGTSSDVLGVITVSAPFEPDHRMVPVDAHPTGYVRSDLPPFLLVVSDEDLPGIESMNDRMAARLRDAGVEVTHEVLDGTDHFGIVVDPRTLELITAWLRAR